VKRTIDEFEEKIYLGVASNYLADLKPGDKVLMTGPSGKRFLLPENAEDFNYILFATGTGIAPFRGMIMELF
jgi:ferredoxin--NADP+ reductase